MRALRIKTSGDFSVDDLEVPDPAADEVRLKVTCCSICVSDAKLCLGSPSAANLPLVPGHEFCGTVEGSGKLFAAWPGYSCGRCRFCMDGHENLCTGMRITGFHRDGGLAEFTNVPRSSLLEAPTGICDAAATLSEPLACAINGLEQIRVSPGMRLVVFGAGTLGLMAANFARHLGADVSVIEASAEKRGKCEPFARSCGVMISGGHPHGEFDCALNATSSVEAFASCIDSLRPQGAFCFFSSLGENPDGIPASALNRIHYRQLSVTGAYGCTRKQMKTALAFISKNEDVMKMLVEKEIRLDDAPGAMSLALSGRHLKFMVRL